MLFVDPRRSYVIGLTDATIVFHGFKLSAAHVSGATAECSRNRGQTTAPIEVEAFAREPHLIGTRPQWKPPTRMKTRPTVR